MHQKLPVGIIHLLPWGSFQCYSFFLTLGQLIPMHNQWGPRVGDLPSGVHSDAQPLVLPLVQASQTQPINNSTRCPQGQETWADECLFGYISCHRVEDQWIVPAILAKWSGCGLETTHQTLMVMIQVEILNTAFRNGPLTELAQAHEKIKCNGWHLLTNHLTAQT
jgi:hypothetical protein